MNICLVSSEYPPETHAGGIGTYTHNVGRSLASMGHEVYVVTATRGAARRETIDGVHVERILDVRVRPQEVRLLYYAYRVAKAIAAIDKELDIVQASEFRGEALVYAMRRRTALITRLATPFYLTQRQNGAGSTRARPVWNWMERSQTVRSDGIVASTKALASRVAEGWGIDSGRVEIIPNSVDVGRILQLGATGEVQGALRGTEYLIYFGRLEERKGVHILADALPSVLESFPNLRMVFAGRDCGYGGDSMRGYIMERASAWKANLVFFDNLPQEKLFPLVRRARLAVLPSLWEAFGFVCLEAMALGCPVVATSGSGFEEIIEDGVSGHLVPAGNVAALTEKLTACLRDEENLARVSGHAESRAWGFHTGRVVPRLVDYYGRVREAWETVQRREKA
jgi:glycogen(starch) synthase